MVHYFGSQVAQQKSVHPPLNRDCDEQRAGAHESKIGRVCQSYRASFVSALVSILE